MALEEILDSFELEPTIFVEESPRISMSSSGEASDPLRASVDALSPFRLPDTFEELT